MPIALPLDAIVDIVAAQYQDWDALNGLIMVVQGLGLIKRRLASIEIWAIGG